MSTKDQINQVKLSNEAMSVLKQVKGSFLAKGVELRLTDVASIMIIEIGNAKYNVKPIPMTKEL
jgi:uncharacterized protein YxjI